MQGSTAGSSDFGEDASDLGSSSPNISRQNWAMIFSEKLVGFCILLSKQLIILVYLCPKKHFCLKQYFLFYLFCFFSILGVLPLMSRDVIRFAAQVPTTGGSLHTGTAGGSPTPTFCPKKWKFFLAKKVLELQMMSKNQQKTHSNETKQR